MSVANDIKKTRKPQRGGMERSGARHAAPRGLARIIVGAFTITMSLLRSWPKALRATRVSHREIGKNMVLVGYLRKPIGEEATIQG